MVCAQLILCCIAAYTSSTIDVFVSPSGDDSANGSQTAPLQHLVAARDKVRQLRSQRTFAGTARIYLMSGTFALQTTLNLTEADSNTSWQGVSDDNTPFVSGGKQLKWEVMATESNGCRLLRAGRIAPNSADVGMVYPELYVYGARAQISRQPPDGLSNAQAYFEYQPAKPVSSTAFRFNSTAVSPSEWGKNGSISDISALIFTAPWTAEPHRIGRIDAGTETVWLTQPLAHNATLGTADNIQGVRRWIALNTPGQLRPGAYRYSSAAQEITYNDCSNASQLPQATVPARLLTTLVRLSADIRGVSFTGVGFGHTATGSVPSSYSYGPAEV
jgi:hypothetical protein